MKKIIAIILSVFVSAFSLGALASCEKKESGKIKIVTSIFPEYDWVMNVLGDKKDAFDVKLLTDKGVDLHSYQPTVQDKAAVSTADMFVYVGGESDEWVKDALKNAAGKNMKVINLLDALGNDAKKEEIVEGMQHDHEHAGEEHHHDHEHAGEEHHHEHEEYDEHVWLSLKNAKRYVTLIAEKIGELDEKNKEFYAANAKAYGDKLTALDEKFAAAVKSSPRNTLLFGDRFPFRYMTDDYGLKYFAAFTGCSAAAEVTPETIAFLVGKVNELSLKVILKIENSDGKIADTLKQNSSAKDQEILTMDSLQSTTMKEYVGGRTYLSAMEKNLEVLKKALA